MRLLTSAACVIAVMAGAASMASGQASFVGLGIHPNFGGMSSDGSTAIGWMGTGRAIIWTRQGGLQFVQPPTGYTSIHFRAISGDGLTIGGVLGVGNNEYVPVRYHPSGAYEVLRDLGPSGDTSIASVDGVSRDGSTLLGTGRSPSGAFAVRWRGSAEPEVLGPGLTQPGGAGAAVVSSADGTQIAALGINRAYRWDAAGGLQPVTPVSFNYLSPQAMSDDGTVIAGGNHAWMWTQSGGFVTLPNHGDGRAPGSVNTMSADGTILAGGNILTSAPHSAFYWTAETGTRYVHEVMAGYGIDLTGWSIRTVQGMSADGRSFMGDGINPQGQWETWYATIPQPLPAPGAVVVFGLAGVVVARRRR